MEIARRLDTTEGAIYKLLQRRPPATEEFLDAAACATMRWEQHSPGLP